ncbi:MAG TPA: transcriptional regulator, partial [Streptomyces sp.]|nr:transcriptional regulator [Streptomyces sp.]
SVVAYHAEPGSASAETLRLLASWGTDAMRAGASAPGRQ